MASELAKYDERDAAVYHLRRGGLSFPEIADRLDLSYSEVMTSYLAFQKKAIAEFGSEERKSMTMLEVDRLDTLQRAVWDQAMMGDQKAIATVLQIINTRTKLLGLDQLTIQDTATLQNVLIIGEAQKDFIDALNNGRKKLTSPPIDDEGGGEEAS